MTMSLVYVRVFQTNMSGLLIINTKKWSCENPFYDKWKWRIGIPPKFTGYTYFPKVDEPTRGNGVGGTCFPGGPTETPKLDTSLLSTSYTQPWMYTAPWSCVYCCYSIVLIHEEKNNRERKALACWINAESLILFTFALTFSSTRARNAANWINLSPVHENGCSTNVRQCKWGDSSMRGCSSRWRTIFGLQPISTSTKQHLKGKEGKC